MKIKYFLFLPSKKKTNPATRQRKKTAVSWLCFQSGEKVNTGFDRKWCPVVLIDYSPPVKVNDANLVTNLLQLYYKCVNCVSLKKHCNLFPFCTLAVPSTEHNMKFSLANSRKSIWLKLFLLHTETQLVGKVSLHHLKLDYPLFQPCHCLQIKNPNARLKAGWKTESEL